jgi:hypothetical protein
VPGLGRRSADLRAIELPDAKARAEERSHEQQDEDDQHPRA